MKSFCIDRFEGEYAVCQTEQGEWFQISKSQLPSQAKESHWIFEDGQGICHVDWEKTRKQKSHTRMLLNRLFSTKKDAVPPDGAPSSK